MSAPGRRDVLFNLTGFGVFAVGALAANLLVARAYGPAVTGLFNQVLALYVVASQIAALGLHLAALREASLLERVGEGDREHAALVGCSLLAVSISAGVVVAIGYLLSFAIPVLFETQGLAEAWRLALPGLFFFAINKVLINLANGFGLYRVFALAQAGRSTLFLTLCALWVASGWPGETIPLALSLAEMVLAAALLWSLLRTHGKQLPFDWRLRCHRLFRFGLGAMPSVASADLNSRVDIVVLGVFVGPEAIGAYTIAAWLIEGAIQLPVAIRPLVNARLAKLASAGRKEELLALIRRVGGLTAAAMAALLALICFAYPLIVDILLADRRYLDGFAPLVILSVGVSIASYYLPFDLLLSQAGHPVAQSRFKTAVLLTNVAMALLLVPPLGITGAALAYSLSFLFYGLRLRRAARRLAARPS